MKETDKLYEVFIRAKNGIAHQHFGSLRATDNQTALQYARDVYTRRNEGVSIWVVESNLICALDASVQDEFLASAENKIYRHPSFYQIPNTVKGL